MKISEFEEHVWAVEGVRIVIRSRPTAYVGDYDFERPAQDTLRVGDWLDRRVRPLIGSRDVAIIQGDGEKPHTRVILRTVRLSYRD